jgi:hypothetical protein
MTRRISGMTERIRRERNALSMRKARRTESGPISGAREIPTITKSKRFQPLRKKRQR